MRQRKWNVELVRTSFDGWNRGDIEAWLAPVHPDIEFRTSGVYPRVAWTWRFTDDLIARADAYAGWNEALDAVGPQE